MLITLLDAIKHAPTISPAVIDNDTVASLSHATDVHKNTDKKTEGDFYQEGSYYYYTGKGNLICWLHLLNHLFFKMVHDWKNKTQIIKETFQSAFKSSSFFFS